MTEIRRMYVEIVPDSRYGNGVVMLKITVDTAIESYHVERAAMPGDTVSLADLMFTYMQKQLMDLIKQKEGGPREIEIQHERVPPWR